MAQEDRRRDHRFAVTLEGSFARAPISVENVAYRGLLVTTKGPVVIGQLRQLAVTIPDVGRVLLHGVPVRLHAPQGAHVTGDGAEMLLVSERVGVRLLGVEPRWEAFVRRLHNASPRMLRIPPIVFDETEAP